MAAADRQPGSDLGRPAIDWEQAFAHYAQLPPDRRGYQAVADEFGVSVRTVERHGRVERWAERLRRINEQAAAVADQQLAHARLEQIGNVIKLIDATFIGYAEKLRRGEIRMAPADLERLYKLSQQLAEQVTAAPAAPTPRAEPPQRTPAHTAEVVHALRESGALGALGLRADTDEEQRDE